MLFAISWLLNSSSATQGPDYPNGTDGVPYWGSNNTLDCGNDYTMVTGCIKIDEFCVVNDGCCVKSDGFDGNG